MARGTIWSFGQGRGCEEVSLTFLLLKQGVKQ